jgi:hypothetical protein
MATALVRNVSDDERSSCEQDYERRYGEPWVEVCVYECWPTKHFNDAKHEPKCRKGHEGNYQAAKNWHADLTLELSGGGAVRLNERLGSKPSHEAACP